MKEAIEMTQTLLEMRTDTYMMCKYMLLAVSMEHQETHNFMKTLFERIDKKRPLLIGIKKEGAV